MASKVVVEWIDARRSSRVERRTSKKLQAQLCRCMCQLIVVSIVNNCNKQWKRAFHNFCDTWLVLLRRVLIIPRNVGNKQLPDLLHHYSCPDIHRWQLIKPRKWLRRVQDDILSTFTFHIQHLTLDKFFIRQVTNRCNKFHKSQHFPPIFSTLTLRHSVPTYFFSRSSVPAQTFKCPEKMHNQSFKMFPEPKINSQTWSIQNSIENGLCTCWKDCVSTACHCIDTIEPNERFLPEV